MPDPTQRLYSSNEFASTIRGMHPEFADEKDDDKLTHAVLAVHPELKGSVVDTLEGSEGAPPPEAYQQGAPPTLGTASVSKFGRLKVQPTPPPVAAGATPPKPAPEPAGYIGKAPPLEVIGNKLSNVEDAIGPLGPTLMTPVRGMVQAAAGLGRMLGIETDPRMIGRASGSTFDTIQNVADVVSGGLKVGTVMLPEAAMAAPLETITGLLAGGMTAETVKAGLAKMGASPAAIQLVSDLAGIIAGGAAAHGAGAPGRATAGLESDFAAADSARETTFRQGVEASQDAQSLKAAENYTKQQAQLKKLYEQLNLNAGLRELAKKGRSTSPFDFVDQANTIAKPPPQPLGLPPAPPPPPLLPENAGDVGIDTKPTVIGAQPDQALEAVGTKPPIVSQPSRPFPELVQSIGEGVSSSLENQGPPAGVRLSPESETRVRGRLREQGRYKSAFDSARKDLTSQMEDMRHDRGGLRNTPEGDVFHPPSAGSPVYWDIVGRESKNPPSRDYITAIMQAYRDSGVEKGKDLPVSGDEKAGELNVTNKLMAGLNVSTEGGARRAYDTWVPEIKKSIDTYARSKIAYEDRIGSQPTGPAAPEVAGAEAGADLIGSKPPEEVPGFVTEPPQPGDELTPGGHDEEPGLPPAAGHSAVFIGYQDDGQGGAAPLYNIIGGPRDRSTVTADTLAQEGITPPETPKFEEWQADPGKYRPKRPAAASQPAAASKPTVFQRLAGEEGHLILDVRPGDRAGLQNWYERNKSEYEDQDWYKRGSTAMAAGDFHAAWEVANVAAARSFAAAQVADTERRAPGQYKRFNEANELPPMTDDAVKAAERAAPERRNRQVGLYDRLKGEGGHLTLDVEPGDRAGLSRWLKKTQAEHGEEDWHQMASDALRAGEGDTAFKLASIAAARSSLATPAAAQKALSAIEDQIGEKLPRGTTINSGVVKLPGNPGGLDPKVTDMTMGRIFTKSLVDLTDPSTIVRITDEAGKKPSDLPKELQIANQMADQYLRETPDELLQPIMDELGISRAQVAAHFARKISDAGRNLGMVGNWVQANEEAFIHLDPDMPSTKGPGAAGRLEFLPEDRAEVIANYMDVLRRKGLTDKLAENLKAAGYEAPEGLDRGSRAAQADARAWLRQRQRQITAGKIVDKVAAKYNDGDTVMAAMGDVPKLGTAIEDISQMSLATMLAQQTTAMKILVSHGVRYALGVPEEILAGVSARARGDFASSAQHFTQGQKMATTPFTQLDYLPRGLLHSPTTDNLEALFEYTRTADPGSTHKFFQALDQFPEEKARLTGARLSEGNDPPSTFHRVRNLLTIGIRASMMATRAAVGDSVLRSLIVAKGDSPLEVLNDPGGIIGKYGEPEGRNMLGTAVSSALNYTYAGNPLPDSPVGKVLQLMHEVPGLAPAIRTVRPFVRFTMATVPRFIWDRMAGLTLPVDLAMHMTWKTGRLSRGLQLDALQRSGGILDTVQTQLAGARFRVSDSLNDSMSAMLDARQAKRALDAIGQRGQSTPALPDLQSQIDHLTGEYDQKTEAANKARADYLAARQEVKDLDQTYGKSLKRANQLREIDAPNWDQYIARQTTGALLMAVAFGVRGMAQNEGTKYYEHRADKDSGPIDLREALAGFAPYLHTADFFTDLIHHTDWKGLKAGKPMSEVYTGRYQTAQTLAQAMDDWFAVSYLTGTAGITADLLTGRAPEALSANAPQSIYLMFLEGIGEQLGRFTTGLETLKDWAAAAGNTEESKRRTPERAGEATPISRILFGPALAHIPFASESLPEKISPFTGEAIVKAHPGAHQATGFAFSNKLTLAEEEINRTGLSYSKAVPKVTGDQELDNQVNRAFAGVVNKYLPAIVKSKEYQARTPELNRDVLEAVFHGMKAAAYASVTSQLDQAAAMKLVKSPAQLQKIQRWKDYLERSQKDLIGKGPQSTAEPEEDQAVPPAPPSAPVAPARGLVGTPPPSAP